MSKPVEKFRDGNVSVSVFENDGPKGSFRSATVQLRYKAKDGEWKDGNNYGAKELDSLIKAATEARDNIKNYKKDAKHAPAA